MTFPHRLNQHQSYCLACKRYHEGPVAPPSESRQSPLVGIVRIAVGECPNPHCYCGRPIHGEAHNRCSQAGCQHPIALEIARKGE